MSKQKHIKFQRGRVNVAAMVGLAVAVVLIAYLGRHEPAGKAGGGDEAREQALARIQPVARVELAAAAAGGGAKTGEQVVQAACAACHATGAAGAPRIGDKAAWGPRLGLGLDGLTKSAIAGKNAMPARGGNPALSDVEIARAIVFMANQSGASFKEPAEKK